MGFLCGLIVCRSRSGAHHFGVVLLVEIHQDLCGCINIDFRCRKILQLISGGQEKMDLFFVGVLIGFGQVIQQIFHAVGDASDGFHSNGTGGTFECVSRATDVTQSGGVCIVSTHAIHSIVDRQHVFFGFLAKDLS